MREMIYRLTFFGLSYIMLHYFGVWAFLTMFVACIVTAYWLATKMRGVVK